MPGKMSIVHLLDVHNARMTQHFSCKFKSEVLMSLPQLSTDVAIAVNNGTTNRYSFIYFPLGESYRKYL